jgi:RHS repeat-associated protein
LTFTYDAQGNRIGKLVENAGTNYKKYEWYVRDAQGNTMAIYVGDGGMSTPVANIIPNIAERYIYGSSMLGSYNLRLGMNNGPSQVSWIQMFDYVRGARRCQLTNHLGTVEAVVSDRKFGVVSGTNSSLIAYYRLDIVMAQDYYPFGRQMPGRGWQLGGYYRYGFNGKENDNEVKGYNGQQDYGMRIYDPRLGRFLSVDPLTKKYPELTPYQFASNRPIDGIDQDGLEFVGTKEEQQGYGLFKLQRYLKQVPSPSKDMLRYMNYANNPASQHILTRDFYGQTIIGKRSDVEYHNEMQRVQHNEALAEEIASSPIASVGYQIAGEKGAHFGAGVSQILFALEGVPGEGYLSKPNAKKWVEPNLNAETEPIPPNMAIVYRTQGGVLPNASQHRILFDKNRNITIEGDEMLYITINDKNHQVYFYEKRGGVDKGAYIVSFQIPASLLEEIKINAVPQKQAENFPGRPQISDPSKSGSAYGLPKEYIDKLRAQAIPGSGKTETPIKK